MDLRQVYEQLQGDYESVMGRLSREDRVVKFLVKFRDKDMLSLITDALSAEDYDTAFREAHNMKGVCANLSLDKLGASASLLTEALRAGKPSIDVSPLVADLESDYRMTIDALQNI